MKRSLPILVTLVTTASAAVLPGPIMPDRRGIEYHGQCSRQDDCINGVCSNGRCYYSGNPKCFPDGTCDEGLCHHGYCYLDLPDMPPAAGTNSKRNATTAEYPFSKIICDGKDTDSEDGETCANDLYVPKDFGFAKRDVTKDVDCHNNNDCEGGTCYNGICLAPDLPPATKTKRASPAFGEIGGPCNASPDCGTNNFCLSGTCRPNGFGQPGGTCETSADCGEPENSCLTGVCVDKPAAQPPHFFKSCAKGEECMRGHCVVT